MIMSDLMSMLTGSMRGGTLESLSRSIGADPETTAKAVSAALPVLIGALDHNTNDPEGAAALFNAVRKDHDGSILDDLAGALGPSLLGDGQDILAHVLGGRQQPVETGVSRASGLDMASVAKLLPMLAPIVLGAIGKMQQQHGFDAAGLSSELTRERRRMVQAEPDAMSALESLLDSNHDGQVADDVVKIGTSLLNSFLK
jgi:hypothetical protein